MQYFLIQFLQTSEIRLSFLKSMYYFLIYTWQVEGDNDELTWWLGRLKEIMMNSPDSLLSLLGADASGGDIFFWGSRRRRSDGWLCLVLAAMQHPNPIALDSALYAEAYCLWVTGKYYHQQWSVSRFRHVYLILYYFEDLWRRVFIPWSHVQS